MRQARLRRERRSEMMAGAFFGVVALVFIMQVIVGFWPSWWMHPLAAGLVALVSWDGFCHSAASRPKLWERRSEIQLRASSLMPHE